MALTESQKTCLRLVARGQTSKEIAQQTGLTPSTIDTYLKSASASLGTANRREAARKFAEIEESQRLGSQSPLLSLPDPASDEGAEQRGTDVRNHWIRTVVTPPPIGGSINDLTPSSRLIAMFKIACLMAAIMAGLTLFSIGMIRLFN
ncbi:helix-turn-helix transcriptional regulator [Sphingomonas aerolata]|uniref:helix-turn-helix domain-containing protein n=1 Tax=Sphingomonas aerolata TaxID=185951 RepID=UPI002FE226A0